MKIGLAAAFGDSPYRDVAFLKDFAQTAEAVGFNSLWFPEHIVFFREYESNYPYKPDGNFPWGERTGLYDPLLACAVAAGVTSTLRFGTTVLVVPERPALLAAKEIMTLDHITGGRFEFGAGLGWSSEEYAALGVSWPKRGKRFDEYLDAMRAVWADSPASYHGEFVEFDNVLLDPKPISPGGPPILIGGNSLPAMRRALRIGDGWYGVWMGHDDVKPVIGQLHECMAAAGRSPGDGFRIKLTMPLPYDVSHDFVREKAETLRGLGVDEFVPSLPITSRDTANQLLRWAEVLGSSC
jgi:probable F420-dependent oxidoreductase